MVLLHRATSRAASIRSMCRRPRDGGAERSCSTATRWRRGKPYFQHRRRRALARPRFLAWCVDDARLGILHASDPRSASGPTSPTTSPTRQRRSSGRADSRAFFYVRSTRTTARPRLPPPVGTGRERGRARSSRRPTRLVLRRRRRKRSRTASSSSTPRPRDRRSLLIDWRSAGCAAAAGRAARARRRIRASSIAATGSIIRTNAGGAEDFKIVTRAARRAGARELARPRAARAGRLHLVA